MSEKPFMTQAFFLSSHIAGRGFSENKVFGGSLEFKIENIFSKWQRNDWQNRINETHRPGIRD